jgi:hypothetical protein
LPLLFDLFEIVLHGVFYGIYEGGIKDCSMSLATKGAFLMSVIKFAKIQKL